jgi:hypothetical protein
MARRVQEPTRDRGASRSKRPRHHERELFTPECTAVRSDPLRHDNVRTRIAQRDRPPRRVIEEKRLQRAGNEVCVRGIGLGITPGGR